MKITSRVLTAAAVVAAFAVTSVAAQAQNVRVRGTIEKVEGNTVMVKGRDGDYLVAIEDGDATCTCAWFAKHRQERGPCRHVLAVEMTLAG